MMVDWNAHRFSGGLLALDVANTVVLRGNPNGFDRFDDAAEVARFAAAATRMRSQELEGRELLWTAGRRAFARLIDLRETTDALFRATAQSDRLASPQLPAFLRACAANLEVAEPREPAGIALQAAAARSALRLLDDERARRVRICANCGWLFLDRSRNGSRRWCDMSVCGNRSKARLHYRRHRERTGEPA